jgi:DNA-binding NtrC family response regulator
MNSRQGIKILTVDDDPENCFVMSRALDEEGYQSLIANSGEEALEILKSDSQVQMVLLDVRMPGMDGVEVLGKIREKDLELPVIIVSAFEHVSTAVKCMRLGAYDYLTKPLNTHELKVTVANALRTLSLQNEVIRLKGEIQKNRGLDQLIGSSAALQKVSELVGRVAAHDISVLITGESGTGKEVVSEAIHMLSPRRDKPFVAVDCTALPEHLVESELFGYEKGAFTGATERKPGRFELANGGTLFLDEIGNLPPPVQMKLLRVLQERQLTRLGGKQAVDIDVRVLSATNSDLKKMMKEGSFREDLFHRLNEFSLQLPPLRERQGDPELLATFFLRRFNAQFGKSILGFSPQALKVISSYAWPGNVRELQNVLKRAVILADREVELKHLPPELLSAEALEAGDKEAEAGEPLVSAELGPLKEATAALVARLEKDLIVKALNSTQGNKVKAAKILQIDYKTLFNKLRDLNIQ